MGRQSLTFTPFFIQQRKQAREMLIRRHCGAEAWIPRCKSRVEERLPPGTKGMRGVWGVVLGYGGNDPGIKICRLQGEVRRYFKEEKGLCGVLFSGRGSVQENLCFSRCMLCAKEAEFRGIMFNFSSLSCIFSMIWIWSLWNKCRNPKPKPSLGFPVCLLIREGSIFTPFSYQCTVP